MGVTKKPELQKSQKASSKSPSMSKVKNPTKTASAARVAASATKISSDKIVALARFMAGGELELITPQEQKELTGKGQAFMAKLFAKAKKDGVISEIPDLDAFYAAETAQQSKDENISGNTESAPDGHLDVDKDEGSTSQTEVVQESESANVHRAPQMITVNGQHVTHGRIFQSSKNPGTWYFTAKLDGVQLRPVKINQDDIAKASVVDKENWPSEAQRLMEKYYPTKCMKRLSSEEWQNGMQLSDGRKIEKFNIYKAQNDTQQSATQTEWRIYAQIGNNKMSCPASQRDLNEYFDKVTSPQVMVERSFGEQLHLKSYYEQFKAPAELKKEHVSITKPKGEKEWFIRLNLGDGTNSPLKPLSYHDGCSYFDAKTANKQQLATKYFPNEVAAFASKAVAATQNISASAGMKV